MCALESLSADLNVTSKEVFLIDVLVIFFFSFSLNGFSTAAETALAAFSRAVASCRAGRVAHAPPVMLPFLT